MIPTLSSLGAASININKEACNEINAVLVTVYKYHGSKGSHVDDVHVCLIQGETGVVLTTRAILHSCPESQHQPRPVKSSP